MRSNFCNFVQRHRSFKISGMGKGRSKDLVEGNRKYEGTDLSLIILHFHGENAPSEKNFRRDTWLLTSFPPVVRRVWSMLPTFFTHFRPFLNIVLERF